MRQDIGEWIKGIAHWREGRTAYISVAFTWRPIMPTPLFDVQ